MSESELKPCDHCGCATIQEWVEGVWRNIRCAECGLGLRYLAGLDIVAAWNRRVDPNPWRYPSRCELPEKARWYEVTFLRSKTVGRATWTGRNWYLNGISVGVYAWRELPEPAPELEDGK